MNVLMNYPKNGTRLPFSHIWNRNVLNIIRNHSFSSNLLSTVCKQTNRFDRRKIRNYFVSWKRTLPQTPQTVEKDQQFKSFSVYFKKNLFWKNVILIQYLNFFGKWNPLGRSLELNHSKLKHVQFDLIFVFKRGTKRSMIASNALQ